MTTVAQAFSKARIKLAAKAERVLGDTCRLILIVGEEEYSDTPCELSGDSSNIDGAAYRISFAWGTPAIIGATVVIDAIPGRPQLTLQLVAPVDSSTSIWQEWRATSGPAFGRADVGF